MLFGIFNTEGMTDSRHEHAPQGPFAFTHVPLAEAWPGHCLELPAAWLEDRQVVNALSKSEPRLIFEVAWWTLIQERARKAISAWEKGRPMPLANLIVGIPAIVGRLEIAEVLRKAIEGSERSLFNEIQGAMPEKKVASTQALARHDHLEQLREAANLIKTGATSLGGDVPASLRQRRELIAQENSIGLRAVESAEKRLRDAGITVVPMRYRMCKLHVSATAPVSSVKHDAEFWSEWPTVEQIKDSRVHSFRQQADGIPPAASGPMVVKFEPKDGS